MPRKEYPELSLKEILQKQSRAGISDNNQLIGSTDCATYEDQDVLPSLGERVKEILGILNNPKRNKTNMLFFVMYDIESNKVRQNIAKYLLKMGCSRIQNSIFLADISREKYDKIRQDLTEIQAMYENNDSILVIPISTDYLRAMKVIGKSIDVDIIMQNRTTLFF